MAGDLSYAIERLQEATTNRRAILENVAAAARRGKTEEERQARYADAALGSQRARRAVEDVAIQVLGEVYHRRFDYGDVVEAITQAHATWLYPIVLDRALDSVTANGDASGQTATTTHLTRSPASRESFQ